MQNWKWANAGRQQLEEEVGLWRVEGALSPAGQRSEVSHASQPGLKALTHQLWPRVRPLTILSTSFFLFLLEDMASWGSVRPSKEKPLGLTNERRWAGKRAANEVGRPVRLGSILPYSQSSSRIDPSLQALSADQLFLSYNMYRLFLHDKSNCKHFAKIIQDPQELQSFFKDY